MIDCIKIKNICSAKNTVKRTKGQAKNWEKIFTKTFLQIRSDIQNT